MAIRGTRTARLRVAAVVSVLVAIVSIAAYDLPALAEGSADRVDPFALVLGSFATDIVALIAAYGAFRRQRWGVILLIVVLSFWALQAAAALVDGSTTIGATALAVNLACLWCCLATDDTQQLDPGPVAPGTTADRAG